VTPAALLPACRRQIQKNKKMKTYQDSSFVSMGLELESINGGVPYTPNGEIFSSGLEMVSEGKDMMMRGGSTYSTTFGFVETIVGGWYLVVGGTADWIGRWL
jgi:hypothetical protein